MDIEREVLTSLVRCYTTDASCSQPANGDGTPGVLGVLGQCEQLGAPLVSTKVICP